MDTPIYQGETKEARKEARRKKMRELEESIKMKEEVLRLRSERSAVEIPRKLPQLFTPSPEEMTSNKRVAAPSRPARVDKLAAYRFNYGD